MNLSLYRKQILVYFIIFMVGVNLQFIFKAYNSLLNRGHAINVYNFDEDESALLYRRVNATKSVDAIPDLTETRKSPSNPVTESNESDNSKTSKEDNGKRHCPDTRPVVWMTAVNKDIPVTAAHSNSTRHMEIVLSRLGYRLKNNYNNLEWDVMWRTTLTHEGFKAVIPGLKPHQLISCWPGTRPIILKSSFADLEKSYIPKSFQLPGAYDAFLSYAEENPDTVWLDKAPIHRGQGVKIAKIKDIPKAPKVPHVVQEFISKPFLVDGRKIEIAIYTTVLSINPLRVYINSNEYLIRICPEEYYPFDVDNRDKYVSDAYTHLSVLKMPSLKTMYMEQNLTIKDTFFSYVRQKGFSSDNIEKQISDIIFDVFVSKEDQMIAWIHNMSVANQVKHRNYYELIRFDFMLDEDTNVYLIEVNAGPMLDSSHHPERALAIERVIYSLFHLVGVADGSRKALLAGYIADAEMRVSGKDITVFPDTCVSKTCLKDCDKTECKLCAQCLSPEDKEMLIISYLEHNNRNEWRRIIPKPFKSQEEAGSWAPEADEDFKRLTMRTRWMTTWFWGMCLRYREWCF